MLWINLRGMEWWKMGKVSGRGGGGTGSLSRLPGRLERLAITRKYDSFGSEPRRYQEWVDGMMRGRCGVKSICLGRRVGEREDGEVYTINQQQQHRFLQPGRSLIELHNDVSSIITPSRPALFVVVQWKSLVLFVDIPPFLKSGARDINFEAQQWSNDAL